MQMFSMPWQERGGGKKKKKVYFFFPQVLRITFQGKSRSDQFKPNRFLGTPALVWLPLGVFLTAGRCDQGVRRRERGSPR